MRIFSKTWQPQVNTNKKLVVRPHVWMNNEFFYLSDVQWSIINK